MSARRDPLDYETAPSASWPTLRTKVVLVAILVVIAVAMALIFAGTVGWSP